MCALYLFFLVFCQVSCQKYKNYAKEFQSCLFTFSFNNVYVAMEEKKKKYIKNAFETHDDDILRQ